MKVIKSKLNYTHFYSTLDIGFLKIGDVVAFDIFIKRDKDYVIIIEAGTLLSEELYNKLKNQDSLYISKKDESNQILSCENLQLYIEHNKENIEKSLQLLYEVNNQLFDIYLINKDNKINLNCVELIIKSIIFLIKNDDKFLNKSMPYFTNNNMVSDHSLHVAIYAIKLGNLLKFNDKQLLQLGTAGLLHDVGYKKVSASILNKNSPLSAKENEQVTLHVKYGVDIVKQNHIHDPYILNAIMHHHERYDGSGYPENLTAEDISPFASILAICDVFDALTNNRPHRKGYSSFEAFKLMMKDSSMVNQFNQKYLQLALKSL
jgi:HD-GYP domain-containing protein (c-di-GMP phosphodiesterase class II)